MGNASSTPQAPPTEPVRLYNLHFLLALLVSHLEPLVEFGLAFFVLFFLSHRHSLSFS